MSVSFINSCTRPSKETGPFTSWTMRAVQKWKKIIKNLGAKFGAIFVIRSSLITTRTNDRIANQLKRLRILLSVTFS